LGGSNRVKTTKEGEENIFEEKVSTLGVKRKSGGRGMRTGEKERIQLITKFVAGKQSEEKTSTSGVLCQVKEEMTANEVGKCVGQTHWG